MPSIARKEKLAVNLYDLDRVDPLIRGELLADKLAPLPIKVDANRDDEVAVEFSCDLLTAAVICDILRGHDREGGDNPTRIYIKRDARWLKVPSHVVFVDTSTGVARLNSALFPVKVVPAVLPGPAVKKIEI